MFRYNRKIFFTVVLFLTMTFMPETPKFHVSKGNNKKAAASLQRLRGKNYDVTDELERIQLEYEREKAAGTITFRELLTKPLYYKPFITMQFMFFFQQFGAINVVMFYVQEIFNDAGTDLDPGANKKCRMFKVYKKNMQHFLFRFECFHS